MPELSDRDAAILTFESAWTRRDVRKEEEIRRTFSVGPARYYQILNRLLDDPSALEADPVNVNRLRKLRDSRQSARAVRSPV